jgi:NAD(P)-dependent dehydrogenase (short-subunit alcohol dehydrogenase family)
VELSGKVALVTGGASGIGRCTARRFAAEGARVVVADVAEDAGEAVAAELGGRFVALDVADAGGWSLAVEEVVEAAGGLHVAFLNAGVATGEGDITRLSVERYRRVLGVNVDGVVLGTRAVVPAIEASGGGAVVATSSLGGLTPIPDDPVYSMTKHAVQAFVRSLAPQLEARGVTVNAVCPAFADTGIISDDLRAAMASSRLPLLAPQVVADAVVRILAEGRTGEAWYCQVGRPCAPYEFRGVPGPRVD